MVKFLGVRRVDFTNKDTGERILGYNFWFTEPAGSGSIGELPFKHFLNDTKAAEIFKSDVSNLVPYLGKPCTIVYNRFRGIDKIEFGK